MSEQPLGFFPSGAAAGDAAHDSAALDRRQSAAADADDSGLLAAADRAHLEREIAAIERASAALRRAEPELESWIDMPAPTAHKPRPVWLLIGALWLSTALVTIGAVFAISALVG
ncbi:MAG: hypothetical protein ACLP19_01635 [Xanthobacteraceae bacterium]